MSRQFPLLTLLLSLLVFGFSSCGDDDDSPNNPILGTVDDEIEENPQFSTLAAALDRTQVGDRLDQATGKFTVFAPTNEAFTAAGIDLASVSDEELTNILNYHVINGEILRDASAFDADRSERASNNNSSPGDNNVPLTIDNDGSSIRINDVANVDTDNAISDLVNGVIYPIDALLVPPTVVDRATLDGRFSILLAALDRTELDDVLSDTGSYTVFAPTDDAFNALNISLEDLTDEALNDILLYHVLGNSVPSGDIPGGVSFQTTLSTDGPDDSPLSLLLSSGDSLTINGEANVVATDVFGSNGVVHAIDQVIFAQSIVDFVSKANSLDSLEQALAAVDRVDDLTADGPFTVFAPVNAAFTAATDTIATFSAGQIDSVLTYHVLPGNFRSDDLGDGDALTTLNGSPLNVSVPMDDDGNDLAPVLITQDSLQVNFIQTDIQATNGVIHLIDGVLLPRFN